MIKLVVAICLSIAMLAGFYPKENKVINRNANALAVATCYGKTPCTACSNCSQCKYCRNGGSCGKCVKTSETYKSESPAAPVSTQCKAITKKGTRCSRKAGSNGYCWQHG
ncbi:MAG: DUF5763 domain-containing protein [Chitinophagaceae bacterium]